MANHALVIAGGAGSRLGGVRKADIRIGGIASLYRVSAALDAGVETRLVATGPSGQFFSALPEGWVSVPDTANRIAGPLAGLIAAVSHLRDLGALNGVLLTTAADTPFLPHDFGHKILAGLGENAAAFAAWNDDFYPPNAAWRLHALEALPERNDLTSLKALQLELGATAVQWPRHEPNPFANFNTLDDLLALQRRAQRAKSGVES